MALKAGLAFCEEGHASTLDGLTFVRVMAISATYHAFHDRMVMGEAKLTAFVEMALKAGFGRILGIDDGVERPTGIRVDTAGAVTSFASKVKSVLARIDEFGVGGVSKPLADLVVADGALFRADELGSRNTGWGKGLPFIIFRDA